MRGTKLITTGVAILAIGTAAYAGNRGDGGVAQMEKEIKQAQLSEDARNQIANAFKGLKFDKAFLDQVKNGQHDLRMDFTEDDVTKSAVFSPDGQLKGIAETIDEMKLPADVKTRIKKAMPNARIKGAEKLTNGNHISYNVDIENREFGQTVTLQLTFDESGKLVLQ